MKSLLLSFALLAVLVSSLHGQADLLASTSDLTVVVKKYEVIQTEIFTADKQLVFANTDLSLIGEQTGKMEVDGLLRQPEAVPQKQKKSTNELILAHYPNSNSLVVSKQPTIMPTSQVSLTTKQLPSNNTRVGLLF